MPRTVKEILEEAEELANRFESHDPHSEAIADATTLRKVREAFKKRTAAEQRLADAVTAARTDGQSWSAIGAMLGTSGETVRQQYGHAARTR